MTVNTTPGTLGDSQRGVPLLVGGSLAVPLLDAAAKILIEDHGLSPGVVSLYRFVFQVVTALAFVVAFYGVGGLRTPQPALNLLRGAFLGLTGYVFFLALGTMPLADATAIFFVQPMFVTLLAPMVLREPLRRSRVLAVLVGFAGALLLIRPNFAAFGAVALLPVAAAALVAVYALLTRSLARQSRPLTMHFYAGLGGVLVLAPLVLAGSAFDLPGLSADWPASDTAWWLLLVIGVVATVSHLLFTWAYRMTAASLLAPFGYCEIASAALLGVLLFGEVPDAGKVAGMLVIVASGIYLFVHEGRTKAQTAQPPVV